MGLSVVYETYSQVSKLLSIITILFIAVFAVGTCIFSCFFSVSETKDIVTIASKIHGVGSVVGFILLLFVPLLLGILSFKTNDITTGMISMIAFVLALFFFVLFIMSDKSKMKETIVVK
ncbi:hypothetical protein [Breznakia pachnodae]|uniref:Cyanate permease n=1 Tax=Breznakia pachnodae TaxID=265178 RepID=A0ABU0E8T9_9FIRM|nr:hypothetical protein [Breznakia pachnodae]MDQ0363318.1 cyanate permease [Breznakia pachnodae]